MKYLIAKIIELATICAICVILIKMGYDCETWQYWVILVLTAIYGYAFASEKDRGNTASLIDLWGRSMVAYDSSFCYRAAGVTRNKQRIL